MQIETVAVVALARVLEHDFNNVPVGKPARNISKPVRAVELAAGLAVNL